MSQKTTSESKLTRISEKSLGAAELPVQKGRAKPNHPQAQASVSDLVVIEAQREAENSEAVAAVAQRVRVALKEEDQTAIQTEAEPSADAPTHSAQTWSLDLANTASSEALYAASESCETPSTSSQENEDDKAILWLQQGAGAWFTLGVAGAGFLLNAGLLNRKDEAINLETSMAAGPFKASGMKLEYFGTSGLLLELSWDANGVLTKDIRTGLKSDVQVRMSKVLIDGVEIDVVTGVTVTFATYTGALLLVLVDDATVQGDVQYYDEVAGLMALEGSTLRAMTTIKTGENTLAITPFTELALRKAGVQVGSVDLNNGAVLNAVNKAYGEVSQWVGVDIANTLPVAMNDVAYESSSDKSAQLYGQRLASLARLAPADLDGGINTLLDMIRDNTPPTGGLVVAPLKSSVAPDVMEADDKGPSDSDNITNQLRPRLKVGNLAEAGMTVELFVDGVKVNATYSAGVLRPDTDLSEGSHNLSFRYLDREGRPSEQSPITVLVLDASAPPSAVSLALLSHDSGPSATDWLTNAASQTIRGTLSQALAAGEMLHASLDGGATWEDITAFVSGTNLGWTGMTLREGSSSLKLKVIDEAGNTGAITTQAYTLDTTAPTGPSAAPDLQAASDSGVNTDNNTRTNRPVLDVQALPADAVAVELLVNGQVVAATYDHAGRTITPNAALSNAVHSLSYRFVDAVGNRSAASAALTVTVDTSAPDNTNISNVTAGNFTGSYEVGSTVNLTIAGVAVTGPVTSNPNGTWFYVPSPAELAAMLTKGSSELLLTVTDQAGNSSQASRMVKADDLSGPYIKEFIPAANGELANDATNHATLNFVFSKAVAKGTTGNIKVYDNSTLVATVPVSSNDVRIEGDGLNDVYVTLPGLTPGRPYSVTIDAGAFNDSSQQPFSGTVPGFWNFNSVAASIAPDFVSTDDMINAQETTAVISVTGKIVSSSTILAGIVSADLSLDVRTPGNTQVPAPITSYIPSTGAFTFNVAANAWSEGTHRYTVLLTGRQGTAAQGITASYAFSQLVVDHTAPTMTGSIQGALDDAGLLTGALWSSSALAVTDDTTPFVSGTLSAVLTQDARVVVYRRDVTDPNNLGPWVKISGIEGLKPTGLNWGVGDSGLQNGHSYAYSSYVEDAAGNQSQGSATKTITVDTSAPTAQVTGIALSQDTGISSTDLITNQSAQNLTGTLGAALALNESLYASLDGGKSWANISAGVTGLNFVLNGVTLPLGTGRIQLQVRDAAGNVGTMFQSDYVVDQTPPSAPSVAPDLHAASDTGSSASDDITGNQQPRFVVGALPNQVARVEMLVGGQLVDATYDATDGTLRPSQVLSEGEQEISFRWVDAAGNVSQASPSLTMKVDAQAPTARFIQIDISDDQGTSAADFVTKVGLQNVSATREGSWLVGDQYMASADGGTTWVNVTDMVNAGGQLRWNDASLTAGTSSLKFKVIDAAGNEGPISTQAYTLDTTAPILEVAGVQISNDTGTSATDFITRDAAQTVSGQLQLSGQATGLASGERLMGSSNGGVTWQDITNTVSGTAFSWTNVPLSTGASSLRFKVADAAGNEAAVSNQAYTLDTVAPTAPQTANDFLSPDQDTGSSSVDDITQVTRPAFQLLARPADALGAELLVNGRMVEATYSSNDNTLTPNVALADGVYQVSYRFIDAAGNASGASAASQVTIDNRAPANITLTTFTPAYIEGTYEPGCTLDLKINGVAIDATRLQLDTVNRTWRLVPSTTELNQASIGLLVKATSTFEFSATDLAGNVTTANATVGKDVFNAPYVKEFIPADGGILANDNTGHATLNLVFSKSVTAGTGKVKLWNSSNALVAEIDVKSSAVRIEGGSDIYVTLPAITSGIGYYVTLDSGSFVDAAGQAYVGKSETGAAGWDFTGAPASIAPNFVALDDIVNAVESAATVTISGKVVASALILEDLLAADLSVVVTSPQGAPAVTATLFSFNNTSGEFVFNVPAQWANGSYSYTVRLRGTAGDAANVNADYNFANLAVDLVAPVGITGSIDGVADNVGGIQGNLFPTSFKLLESGFASGTPVTKITDINVTDLVLANLSGSMAGAWVSAGPAVYNSASTVYNGNRSSVTFWMQRIDGGLTKAVKLQLNDTASGNGIELRIIDAAFVSPADPATFNWNNTSARTSQIISTSLTKNGYGLTGLEFVGSNMAASMLGSGLTDDATPTLGGSLTRALGQGERIAIDRTGTDGTVTITGKDGLVVDGTTWAMTDGALSDGQYTYRLYVEDAAGNRTASSATRTITVDTVAPTAAVTAAALSQDSGVNNADRLTKVAAQSISGTLSAALGAGEKLMASLDGGTTFVDITTMVSGTTFNWSGVTLPEGESSARWVVVDATGNRGAAWSLNFTLDTTAPAAPTAAPDLLAADDSGISNSDNITATALPQLVVGALPSGVSSVELLINGAVVASQFDAVAGTLKPTSAMADGSYAVSYRYLDAAGNISSAAAPLSLTIGAVQANAVPVVVASTPPLVISLLPTTKPDMYLLNHVRALGDVNNDGFDDFALSGLMGVGLLAKSESVFYGSANYTAPVMTLSQILPSARSVLTPATNQSPDRLLAGIAAAGDFNSDGIADVLAASQGNGSGVITPPSANFYFDNRPGVKSTEGQQILGGEKIVSSRNYYDGLGGANSLDAAGDLNRDGRDDVVIGADMNDMANRPGYIFPGQVYAVYGTSSGVDISVSTGRIADGAGFKVSTTASNFAQFGLNTLGIGDLNGDGFADFVARSPNGGVSFLYGGATGLSFNETTMTAAQGFKLSGLGALPTSIVVNGVREWVLYKSVAYAGDFNGDGYADAAISDPASGKLYVTLGKSTLSNLAASSFNSANGYVITGLSSERFGHEVSYAGDLNADGLGDLIVSAEAADGGKGTVYVIFGRSGTQEILLTDVANGIGGFAISNGAAGTTALGFNVSNAGDINGDGLEDLIVGSKSTNYDPYLLINNKNLNGSKVTQMGTAVADQLNDNGVSGSLIGGLGNDTLSASAASVLYGGAGSDTFVIGSAMADALENPFGLGGNTDRLARIDGGTGLDILKLASGVDLDFTAVANQSASLQYGGSRIDDVEVIDLSVAGSNTIKLTLGDVIDMSSSNVFQATGRKQLLVKGTTGDTLDFADGAETFAWTQAANVTIDTVVYSAWNHNTAAATVYVQSGIFVV
jgi:hypothetical protein